MSSNQALMDALTLRQIFIERYSKGEAQRLLTHLQRLSRQLQTTISTEYERVRAVRLAQQVSGITQTILDEYGDDMADGLRAFAEAEAEFARQTLVATTAAEVISPGSLRQIQAAITKQPMRLITGKVITEVSIDAAAKQFSKAKAKQIAQLIRDGATVGRTTQELVNEVALLVEGRTKAQAASLVRTSTNHIGNVARAATYEANDDVITGEEFVATLDARTTLTCAGHDSEIFPIGQGPQPPLHWSCRSVRTPVINPEYNLGSEITGQRASADGPVSADVSYGGWLKRQSAEVQDEVLGVERAKLFRSGKLSIGKFTDDTGKVYSLERLKELNPLAFGGKVSIPDGVGGSMSSTYSSVLNSAHPRHIALMNKVDKPKAIKTNGSEAYYAAFNRTILADPSDRNGNVLLHEYGHHVDYQLGGGYIPISAIDKGFISAYDSDRASLGLKSRATKFDSMERIQDDLYEKVTKTTKTDTGTRVFIKTELKNLNATGISDIVDSLAQGSYQKLYGGYGHGVSYYKEKVNRQTEIFANLFYLRSTDMWEKTKEMFPSLSKRFQEIIDEALE